MARRGRVLRNQRSKSVNASAGQESAGTSAAASEDITTSTIVTDAYHPERLPDFHIWNAVLEATETTVDAAVEVAA